MDIYLDANATTPVLAQARQAALAAMAEDFGNPSSVHSTGLKARALMDATRERARRVLGVQSGQLLFVSGATEGIQTAVLSALHALRQRRAAGEAVGELLLYGATEHKAVPEALRHWNDLLGLGCTLQAIPVGSDGRHDLAWLRAHAARAGLVCTMAANNETGVVSDLAGIAAALAGQTGRSGYWMVDGVQGLGKLDLHLQALGIDYAPFSGHKLYAPKGIGLLYVREGAPFTPLIAGGGQEGSLRSGTENMSGIAALGAVLAALEDEDEGQGCFRDGATLQRFRLRLLEALRAAFPELVLNAPLETSLPTTLNFAVPGTPSKLLLDLFDAADVRVSGGSACSAAKAAPSFVLEAMGLPAWQTAGAIRMSFGPVVDEAFIAEACARIRACGEALRVSREAEAAPVTAQAPAGAGEAPRVLDPKGLSELLAGRPDTLLLDVRELYEQRLTQAPRFEAGTRVLAMPLSRLLSEPPAQWGLPPASALVCFCRSGNRSAQAALALARAGHAQVFTLAGGLALWPRPEPSFDAALYV